MSVVLVTFPSCPVVNEEAKQRDEEVILVFNLGGLLPSIVRTFTLFNLFKRSFWADFMKQRPWTY